MIKANELRIGNLILFDGKITHANTRNIAYISNSNRLKNRDSIAFEPLKLTEEWLLKAMFEKFDRHFIFKNNTKFFIELDLEQNYCLRMKITKDSSAFICQLDYVHQLQNAMFVFCGEELVFFSTEP